MPLGMSPLAGGGMRLNQIYQPSIQFSPFPCVLLCIPQVAQFVADFTPWVFCFLEHHSLGTRQESMPTMSESMALPSSFTPGTESRTDTEMSSSGVTRYCLHVSDPGVPSYSSYSD